MTELVGTMGPKGTIGSIGIIGGRQVQWVDGYHRYDGVDVYNGYSRTMG